MELYNDLKFSGKGLYDIINDDNSYTNQGIIFNSNQDFSIQPNSINFKYQPSFNNILHISSNSNIGIGIQNPKYPLEVAGSISCFDMNINNSILNKDVIYNIGFSANDIKNGILKINNGGIGSNSLNKEELLIGDIQQSPFLIWKDNERRLGIGISNPLENVDVDGDTNAIYYRKDGIDIREIFVKDLSISSNECFFNSSNANFINSLNYTNVVKDEIIKYIDSRTIDWIKYGKNINYIYSKVGIGTAEPSSSLYIIGDINYSGQLRRNGVLRKIFYGDYADLENNKGYAWELSNGEVFNLNAGCVGIGSQIPRYNLDIDGGINFQSNMKRNGNIINFFDSDFNKLSNIPPISKFGYSGSFNNLTETPFIFINKYSNLNDIPFIFPANWNTSISNIPTFFPTDWNTQVFNKPDYFLTNWNSSIDNKPKFFDVDWNATIYGKPDFFPASWCNIINKPDKFNADWYSNILNVPAFEKVAFTGQYSNLLNRPKLFSGLYKDLREKPKYSRVAFTGNYYQLSNLPNLFTGEFSTLSNLPTNFQADWNTTLINKPDFSRVAYSGLYYDTIGFPIDNWGENGNHIYSCNSSNIGIGITNPEFKLDLKGGFNANNIFSVNYNKIIKDNQPWGIYFAEDWNGTTLPDVSGNNRNTTTSGTINLLKSNGNGATSEINYISGGTSSTILWPSGSIPSTFTIVSLTRYTGGSRGRILQSRSGMNWLHGHWNGNRGVCYYEGWKTSSSSTETLDDWLICIGRNTSITPNNIIVNGVARGDYEGGNGNGRLCLNGSDYGEASDWAFGCVLIWDKKLTDEECFKLNDIIKSYLDNGGSLKKIMTTNLEINGISYINNNTNLTFVSSDEYYRTSNWNKVNSSNIYNYNSGSIGINTNIPSSSYKLDVKGLINANNLLLNEGLNWSSCNAEIRMPKTNNSSYSPSSLIDDLIIRSQVNKKIIIANGTNEVLFLNSGNIGIGTTSPQSTIHIHNSSSNQDVKLNLSTSFYISKNSNNEGIIWNSNNNFLSFGTNNLEQMKLNNIGNIGIGTTNPQSTIHIHNSSSNQEVKINLTDASTTSGFSIYKSSNHEGFLWNSNNNFIAFGTNNLERMRINNGGFIGLGTINPQSTIHIHNSSSNQEIKINLSTSFLIYKSSNNEGYIWNSNKGINFGTNYINRLSISSSEELTPWGIYHAGNYSNNTLYDLSGNNRHAITSGTITSGNSNGNGATSNIKFISGGTSATINWPLGSIPNNFTILTLTRYNGATRRRIIMAQSGNWLHGHHNGNRGVCHYDGWKTPSSSTGTQDNWLCCIGRNLTTTPNNIIVDGIGRGNATGGTSNLRLSVNIGNGETSDWSLSYVVIWNRHLTDDEVFSNNSLITTYLTNGTEPIFISSSISGGKTDINISSSLTSLNLYNYSLNQEVKINLSGFSIYKSNNHDGFLWNSNNNFIAFGTNNIERMRLNNLGNIGIGTNNPQSTIHIHNSSSNQEIKINLSTSFFLSKNSNNEGIIWNSSNNFIAFGTNNLERMRLTNGRFIGLGTTNPQSTLHIHNSSSNQEVKIDFSGFSIYKSNNHDGFLWNSNNNFIAFGTNNIERLRISNTGKIGIGTNNTTSDILRINGTIRGNLRGNGNSITNLNSANFTTGSLNISNGGLGISNPILNQVLIGNSSNPIIQSANLIWSNNRLGIRISNPSNELDVNQTVRCLNLYGNGSLLTNLQFSNVTNERLNVNNGGTGLSNISSNQLLSGNGSNLIISTNIFWNNSTRRLGINLTNINYTLDINDTINGSFRGDGSLISNINAGNFSSGTLNITSGGFGTSSLTSGNILIANTTTNNLFWHITSNFLGINNSSPSYILDINGTLKAFNIEGNGSNLTNLNIAIFNTINILNVNKGGTGKNTITSNKLLTGNGTSSTIIETTNLIWNGSDKLIINSNNFDVGITNNLTIFGDINFTGNIRQNGYIYIGTGLEGYWNNTYGDSNIYYNYGTVGINTLSPNTDYKLDVNKNIKCNILKFNQDIDLLSKTLRLNKSQFSGSTIKFNNNTKIDYLYGGSTYDTFQFDTELLSADSTNKINGFKFENGRVLISNEASYSNNFNLNVKSSISYSNLFSNIWVLTIGGGISGVINFHSNFILNNISAYFQSHIIIKGSIISSCDIRIKNNINDINSKYALEIISKINPKTFKYIDYFEYGTKNNYGFIAQDIKKLIPEAIEFRKEFIPNIMKTFNINEDIIETNEDLTSKLNINDIIQIIDIDNKKEKYKILEISSNHIKIDKNIEGNKCFIYGKEVDDFHNLSKDIIYTLNVSATQELIKKLKKQKKILKTQEEILKTQEEILMEQERRFEEQEKQIKYLLNII